MKADQENRAKRFRELHHQPHILVLLNAWDVASARLFEAAGAPAVATTSSGLAASFGYLDGEKIDRQLLIDAVGRICHIVGIPVSVDLEAGYGATAAAVRDSVEAVIDAGAIGINIEDGVRDSGFLVERIAASRDAASARGVPLFINARADVYLRGTVEPAARFEETLRRLRAYEEAGADGLFVPGLGDAETIGRLAAEVHLPLNILAGKGVPRSPALERLGVKRVSVGGGPMRAALTRARQVAEEVLRDGSWDGFANDTISHAELSQLLGARPASPRTV